MEETKKEKRSYVDVAEAVMQKLSKEEKFITTSQIRTLLAMSADIYNEVVNYPSDELSQRLKGRIDYLRVNFIYQASRDGNEGVRELLEKGRVLQLLKGVNGSKKKYITFNRYMEALVAFHKFYSKDR